jgi:hypothetical protein
MKKVLKVMDKTGDSCVEFDSEVDNQAKSDARKLFDSIMAKGSAVFSVKGNDSEQVRNFDALGEQNVVVPRITGG